MGNLYYTFDSHYYTFMGNCTYTMVKNCNVGATLPAFEVDIKNMNEGDIRVPSVGKVTVNVYGINIEIDRSEYGIARVNYQQWSLPIILNDGNVKLFQRGLFAIVETNFGLTVQYDWNQYLAITVPGSFAGSVCGLCGNFNSKKDDDLMTPSGSVASSVAALGESWKVLGAPDDTYCKDECGGQCEKCPLSEVEKLEKQIFCSTLIQDIVELAGCQPDIDSTVFQSNCMLDLCRGEAVNTYLCNTLQGYADICQRSGAKVPNWRTSTQCPIPKCPENSHYEFCGSGCPATCVNPDSPTKCTAACVETCACDDGFLLSGTKCVPKAQCGCLYEGRYVEPGKSFWGDESCTKRYTCSAGGNLSLKQTSCPAGQQCQVEKGIRNCYPVNYATCMVSGDPHLVTFDGERYNFQGTCAYEMAGVSSNQTALESFTVVLQNNGQDKKIGSSVKLVEVKVYGYTFVISKDYPGSVVVNGELSNLPMSLDNNKLHLYTSGWFAVIETNFGVKVYYDWNSVAFVIVPSTYKGVMQGLCGNYNLNPKDDMQMTDGKQAPTSEALGQSWKVGTIPGCVDGCSGTCPGCNTTQRALYNTNTYCGLITDPTGPFRDCHAKVDPSGFLNDCLYDVCLYQGSRNMQCKTLTAYTAACQLKGAKVYTWRSAEFCDAQCPSNSHYELCTSSCTGSCVKDSTLSNCGVECMEGCACSEGYLLSGDECVPENQCGCMYEGKYYQQGQVFYLDALCQKECSCNGTVQCKQSSCGLYEKCEMKNYVRSCQPLGKGVCSISGDPHYNTFDNATYNFQGTCTYIAAEGCQLSGTRLTNFLVAVENEKWYRMSDNPKVSVAKLVAVEVYDTVLILRRNEVGMVWINGVLHHLPQSLFNGAVKVYQEGANDVIFTDFGLRVTYDLVYHITVTVPGNYRGRTCGLCGNFNNDKTDEFQLPDGKVIEDFNAFGAAWKVPVPGVVCEDGCSGNLCPKCDDSKIAALESKCAIITNPSGPFAACHDVIDPAPYFRDCVYDVCMAKDEQSMVCHSIAAYMLDCQDFGAKIQTWRSPSFCPFTCHANSHYDTCVLPCLSPCPGLIETVTCTTTCVEGCVCDKGYFYNGTGCVPFDQCSCYYNGQTYKVGQSVITDDCHRIHTCQASGVVLSKNMTCDPNESCQVKNGVMGCLPQQCFLDSNGTLTAFTGESGTITVPGAYEIIQSCDQSQALDWFRVVVKLEMCTPGTNTIVAVYVFFSEVMITVNNKHDIWINGRPITQTTFSQNNVNVVVSDKTVRITSPTTLQLSFSSTNQLTMSVSDEVADMVCGVCGKLKPVDTTLQGLSKKLLKALRGSSTAFASLNIGQWTAPDFPQCGL
ncbi:IgGFc-binding protein-like [Toxotes jaculatrix]|uniref:IgGFc-binding protein-like n=1 Tax=Toxotes jaculatrix TaxID=941984 RepID=UPI001B3AF51C|nr:IgGFc-binding protein-like [Toxotes jaculatrix]